MAGRPRLLIISFDAVGDRVFDRISALPNTGAFLRSATTARQVRSVFPTNTYPVHASVVTGLPPAVHGLISNEPAFPERHPVWNYRAAGIGVKTLWQAARERGLSTASVLWPVTGGARDIRWNMPEIMPRPGDNQILINLKNGSKLMQLELWLRYRHLLEGIDQPARDRFAAACMADVLRRRRPHLALMHFTCYDTLCHTHGEDFDRLQPALETLDEGLGLLLSALDGPADAGNTDAGNAGDESADRSAVILFSDHAQLPLKKTILPNDLLVEMGLLGRDAEGNYRPGKHGCFIECCGGSAFFHPGALPGGTRDADGKADGKAGGKADDRAAVLAAIRKRVEAGPGFKRWLRPDEMAVSGRENLPFGFCASEGYAYGAWDQGEKAQHGYPADYDNYGVFYAVRGTDVPRGKTVWGGSLLDIAPLALRLLGAGLPAERRPALPGLPEARGDFFEREER